MKKLLYICVPIAIILIVVVVMISNKKATFSPTGGESPFSSSFGDVQAPGPATDISVSDLAKYFNERLAYSLPKGSTEKLFTPDFKSASTQYGDPVFEIFDFTGDGKKDAMVVIPFLSQAGWTDFYVISNDPKIVPDSTIGNINEPFSSSGSKLSKEEMLKFGPGKTIPLPSSDGSYTGTLHWTTPDRDGFVKITNVK